MLCKLKNNLEQTYTKLFGKDMGKILNPKATIRLPETVKPTFHQGRSVQYAYREKLENELEKLKADWIHSLGSAKLFRL